MRLFLAICFSIIAFESQALERGETDYVVGVVDGDTVELSSGDEVRLIGLQAPKLPLGRSGFPTWPLASESRAYLARLVLGREVTLGYDGNRRDRHGRLLAQLYRDDGLWIQEQMIAAGMARVYSFFDNRSCAPALLTAERIARSDSEGIWGLEYYRVREADNLDRDLDTYQLVEGSPVAVAEVRGRYYLNFGEDWNTDFTATIAPRDAYRFEDSSLDVTALEGRNIRLRGWLSEFNGPNMELTHPEQIEILGPESDPDKVTISTCQFSSLEQSD